MFSHSFAPGQHVVARDDVPGALGALGYPRVSKGTRGIVRACPSGFFSSRYTVEFYRGGTVSVEARYLKSAMLGGTGEDDWQRYKHRKQGVALGLFVFFGVPAIVGLVKYYAGGGSTAGLIAALPNAALEQILSIVALIGLPLALLLAWFFARSRRR